MKFRTEIKSIPGGPKIDYDSNIVLFGSCFSEHIREKLSLYKFQNYSNPFGILFNPVAIATAVKQCADGYPYRKGDLMENEGHWLSLEHHSEFNNRDKSVILDQINRRIEAAHQALLNASHVVVTLGTSWVYRWNKDGHIVGNCHKIPQKYFTKELLGPDALLESLKGIVSTVRGVNKDANLIFTVSPVRHLKDGFVENSLSKGLLLAAIHELKKESEDIHYFPSYEIMMDDLRDYRFYEKDLVHPNETAVDYIWEHFKKTWIRQESQDVMSAVEQIQKSLDHRPFDPGSAAHQKFLDELDLKIKKLTSRFPQIEFHKKRK